jgi:regulatory protein
MKNFPDEFEIAMKKAAGALSKRMHSCFELERKLAGKKIRAEVIRKVITELLRLDYLNDSRFAAAYAEELSQKGFGRNMILKKMMARGLSKDLCEKYLQDNDDDSEKEKALAFLASKRKSLEREKDPRKRREKTFRVLMGKGFSPWVIREIISVNE